MPIPTKKMTKHFKNKANIFDIAKKKDEVKVSNKKWSDRKLPNPFDITKKFIMDKGLKVYGGLALHEHLKKQYRPIYNKFEFPDYDVFSPNAWEHAKELCDILYDMGFEMVDVRSSILNNEKHQTYKVSVDMIYILDLTQLGCTRSRIKNQDCGTCGRTKDDQCISIFNNIPAYNILSNDEKEFRKVYNYKTNDSLFPNKLFVCSPDWLKISMYREITEPLSNPGRLEKVSGRLAVFEEQYPFDNSKCDLYNIDLKNKEKESQHRETHKKVLQYIEKYINSPKNDFVHKGVYAYNFYVNGTKHDKLPINTYEVYTTKQKITDFDGLIKRLKKQFPNYTFKMNIAINYWKEVDYKDIILYGKKDNQNYSKLAIFVNNIQCLPYVKYNSKKYITFDRMKYHFYRNIALVDVLKKIEKYPLNYSCMLKNLLEIEKDVKKKDTLLEKGKFRSYVLKCFGEVPDLLKTQLINRFEEKLEMMKTTKFFIDTPKKGFITKEYKTPDGKVKLPYVPKERSMKKYYKYNKKTKKFDRYKSHNIKDNKDIFKFNNKNII